MVHGAGDPGRDGVADYVVNLSAALRDLGVRAEPVPIRGGVRGLVTAAGRVRALRPDVVHVQFAPSAFGFSPWPGLLPDLLRAPVVVTVHEYGWWSSPSWIPAALWEVPERKGWFDRETWRLAPAAAAVVTTNAGHGRTVAGRLGRDAAHVPLAPNVADHGGRVAPAAVRRRLGVPADAEVMTFFGFVHPVKGLRYLIEALAILRDRRPPGRRPLHLLVLGGFTSLALPEAEADAFRAELAEQARACGVADQVTMTGHLAAADVSAALHASDLAVFPFTAGVTTKSGALLAAFAHGLPTVITAADPPDPQLRDGDTVVVAHRVRDARALADAVGRVLDDAELRARVRAGGATVAADRTWPRIAEAHRELYRCVVAGREPELRRNAR
jgi:glycosyltransferase involved in cell wall biosynthesis